jgi:hypothetical protein
MGVDLRGKGGELHLGWPAWSYCLSVAHAFGWEPEGTKPPRWIVYHPEATHPKRTIDEEETARMNDALQGWDGSYFCNEHQSLTKSDAVALSAALDRAIAAVKTTTACAAEQMKALAGGENDAPFSAVMATLSEALPDGAVIHRPTFAYDIEVLKALADYARQGGFVIG